MTNQQNDFASKAGVPLFLLRLTGGLFLLQWGVEKLVVPEVTGKIFAHFYKTSLPISMTPVLGILEVLVALAVITGFQKRVSYGLAFLIHFASVVATWKQLIDPYGLLWGGNNHLFMTGVPVLAGFFVLYRLRDYDTLFSLQK